VSIVSVIKVWLGMLVLGLSVAVLLLVVSWVCVFVVFAGTWVFHALLVWVVASLLRI
jgi:hypothetical protein